jgi:predicted ATPase
MSESPVLDLPREERYDDQATGVEVERFEDATFPLRGLTVLTGLNGMGKSTAMQAVLLARQASENLRTLGCKAGGDVPQVFYLRL